MKIFKLFLFLFIASSTFAQTIDTGREKGQLLVMLKHNINLTDNVLLKAEFESKNVVIDHHISRNFNIWLFTFDEDRQAPEKILQIIRNHPAVEIAQFNHKVQQRELIPNDPSFNIQWAFKNTGQSNGTPGADIKATEAWDITTSGVTALGDSIVIAVVDGGIDLAHDDLNYWKNYHEIPGNFIDDDNNGYMDDFDGWNAYSNTGNVQINDHGTHVAGIVAAKTNNELGVAGVSFNSKVLPVAGSGNNEALVVSSYDYVYTMRKLYNDSQGSLGAFIVASNSSFGIDGGNPADYPLWSAMYDSMGMVGIINVASTANRGWDVDINGDIPTAMTNESLITVTNTTNLDLRNTQAAWGHNSIDLGAPGTSIYSTRQGNTYGNKTGTSMSSPMVSGSIALLYAASNSTVLQEFRESPELAVAKFKRYILATVDTIPTLVGMTVSGGRLNLLNAVMMAANPPMLSSNPTSISLALKPNTFDKLTIQLSSSATEPDLYSITLDPHTTWMQIDTYAGVLNPGVSEEVHLIFNTTGMAEGIYNSTITVNDYFLDQLVIPVTLKVDRHVDARNLDVSSGLSISPNPFDQSMDLNIDLAEMSPIKISIYNLQGVEIASYNPGTLPAGHHTFKWNGLNHHNQSVSPGIYFISTTVNSDVYNVKAIKSN
ncbi:MAG: S8 family serine peptidase [Lentimicrobiaceae bacterium]